MRVQKIAKRITATRFYFFLFRGDSPEAGKVGVALHVVTKELATVLTQTLLPRRKSLLGEPGPLHYRGFMITLRHTHAR